MANGSKKDKAKPWSGRFEAPTDPRVDEFTGSIGFDRRLAREDLAVNRAHGRMLNKIGLLSDEEWKLIEAGLNKIEARLEEGRFVFRPELEDVHMNIEAALISEVGPVGAKIHTARSRNDQVATDLRLFLRAGTDRVLAGLWALRRALVELAGQHLETILPGYTHLQRAQPIRLAHYFLAYDQMIKRDMERFMEARQRTNLSPLGAAALAGTTFPVDREMTAQELGFEGLALNSLDAVADRDFVLDFLFASAVLMVHLSRLAEELTLWSSQEFGFIDLADSFTTGSSIMPQKKNPDVAELIRGKTGRIFGHLVALLTVLKGLPLAYDKDLQEDKEPVFDALDTVAAVVEILPDMLTSMKINQDRMRAACRRGFLEATDLADWLAAQGVPFREAHHQVGGLVKFCLGQGRSLTELSLEEMRRFCPQAQAEVFDYLALDKVVDRRASLGGTGLKEVRRALDQARAEIETGRQGKA
ncbi:MAG: argininosuccinate lyase [Deltaproteobacteria bacterium]|nr:argininosuccinate lyase [Deltaproteobacteria bacterium]